MPRLMPDTLRGRVTATIVVISVAVVGAMFGILTLATDANIKSIARVEAANNARSLDAFLRQEAERLDQLVRSEVEWAEFYRQTSKPDPAFIDSELRGWISGQDVSAILWTDLSGKVIYLAGSTSDSAVLRSLASAGASSTVIGTVSLHDGPAVAVSRDIVGYPPAAPVGRFTVARHVSPGMLADFSAVSNDLEAAFSGKTSSAGFTQVSASTTPGIGRVWMRLRDQHVDTLTELTDPMGTRIGTVLITEDEKMLSGMLGAQSAAALLAAGFALLLGLLTSLVLARFIDRPLERFNLAFTQQGAAAIDGRAWTAELITQSALPREFREIGRAADDLLTDLSLRQAQLRAATAATEQAEESLEAVVNGSTEAKLLIENGIVRVANPAVTACFGLATRRLTGLPAFDAMRDLDLTLEDESPIAWDELVERALEGWVAVHLAIVGRGERWLSVRAMHPQASDPSRLLVTAHDITDSRELENLRTEVLSMVTHDLRTPLTVITGYLDLLGNDLQEHLRARAIDSARASADRMRSMLDDLVDSTRAREIFAPKVFETVRLDELARDVAESLQPTHPGHTFNVIEGGPTVVLGEDERLRQVVTNLLTNAGKYSPTGTTITVTVGHEDGHAILMVDDEGPGVPRDQREAVFDRFMRLPGSDQKATGMGLGLHIVRVIVEGHGGSAHVEDAPGGGARFVVRLPLGTAVAGAPSLIVDPRD